MCSACAQTSGIAEPLGWPGSSSRSGIGAAVPHLLGQQLAGAGAGLHRRQQPLRLGAAAGRQFVVRALAGQQRPDTADAGAVIRAAVVVLAVAVAVVAPPARSVRQIDRSTWSITFTVSTMRGSSAARSPKRTSASASVLISSSASTCARPGEAIAHLHRAAQFGARLAGHLGRDAHVVAGDADLVRQPRVGDVDPVLDLLVPRIGGVAQEVGDVVDLAGHRRGRRRPAARRPAPPA